jgi:hypothetical protein
MATEKGTGSVLQILQGWTLIHKSAERLSSIVVFSKAQYLQEM